MNLFDLCRLLGRSAFFAIIGTWASVSNAAPTAIVLIAPVSSLAEDSNTSSATKLGDVVITDPDGNPIPPVTFSTNTGNLSNGVLTLLDDKYADLNASTMGNWGTESFEFSVSIKSADGSANIAFRRRRRCSDCTFLLQYRVLLPAPELHRNPEQLHQQL